MDKRKQSELTKIEEPVSPASGKKGFEDALEAIHLSEEAQQKVISKASSSSLIKGLLGVFGLGSVAEIISLGEKIAKDMRNEKVEYLLASYMSKTDGAVDSVEQLKNFILNPQGNILFNKLLRITDENSSDYVYISILSRVLKRVVDSDFSAQFYKHKYALSIIEQLSPQAIVILADSENWVGFKITRYSSDRGVIQSEWIPNFVESYAPSKKITDDGIIMRLAHAIQELQRGGLILARIPGATDSKDFSSAREADKPAICELTPLGIEVRNYF